MRRLRTRSRPSASARTGGEFLQQRGFSEAQVVDIVLITCLFNFMDRLADGLGVELDPRMQKLVAMNADKG